MFAGMATLFLSVGIVQANPVSAGVDIATVITDLQGKLEAMSLGGLIGLWFQSLFAEA